MGADVVAHVDEVARTVAGLASTTNGGALQAKTKANMKLMLKGTAAKDMWLKKGAKGGLMALVANNNSVNTV